MTKVKICGITNLEDAAMSVRFGADEIGFNFFEKSARYIDPLKVREIFKSLVDPIVSVGVFVNESVDYVTTVSRKAGIDLIQLHGDETPEFARVIRKLTALPVIKAFRVSDRLQLDSMSRYQVEAFLLDSYSHEEYGGTGEKFDWNIAKQTLKHFPKIYLAGGLNPDNIGEAVKMVRPYAVDACSGLESSKGIKDLEKVEEFIRSVREAL